MGVEWSKAAGQVYTSYRMDIKWPEEVDEPHGHGMASNDDEKVA